ncbi:prolyl oligopeptidase family serine peptidase [Aeromonas bestiarum]|uniref:Prolyl oligopeptidase family serine peptidase n=1 Tax=Aeromonas bestiarum TaxID=105751 RepID=A0ABT7PU21_9GAMM|nr:prolyl oligopeptidase family serine peptidase [Aeromonas bestiarum]MDM5070568.1 prolyl oligopeptidase family serine peptidase [Aeromonas bestiarum]
MHALLIMTALLANPATTSPTEAAGMTVTTTAPQSAPAIAKRPLLMKGDTARRDPYGGWRDDSRQDPALLAMLGEQNRWTEQQLAGQRQLEQTLQAEWQAQSRGEPMPDEWISEAGSQWRMEADGSLWQRDGEQAEPRQRLATRQPASGYYELASWALHPNGRWLALAEDLRGDRDYRISLLDLADGKTLATLAHRAADLLWSLDGKTLYTLANERRTLRPWQLWAWQDGKERLVHQEADPAWLLSLYRTTDRRHLLLQSNNHDSSEQYLLDEGTPSLLKGRQAGLEYYLDTQGERVLIKSNKDGALGLYQVTSLTQVAEGRWQPLWSGEDKSLEKWRLFADHTVLQYRHNGDDWLDVLDGGGKLSHSLLLTEGAGTAWIQGAHDPASGQILIRRQGMAEPPHQRWLNLASGQWQADAQVQRPSPYRSERRWVVGKDGVKVPVSLVWRTDIIKPKALLLYGYGAYGTPMRPYYQPQVLSLLDRGFVYAIAHVRGGGMLGDDWYLAGRGRHKQHSMDDFLAVAEALARDPAIDPARLFAMGGSAGGLLVAAALNQAPTRFAGAVLQVPFVDLLGTMSDPELPLTRQEYAEWGNPAIPADYAAMRRLSPYDNLHSAPYPPVYVTAGLHDSQVPYWEPLKWVARLREHSTGTGPYLLSTALDSGHQASAGTARQQAAREYAFLLTLAGVSQ